MDEQYSLEKKVWTEADFDRMGWHDSRIYAIAFGDGISGFQLDLDMIFRWVPPTDSSAEGYQFWIAPATLIFHGVSKIEVEFGVYTSGPVTIDSITRNAIDLVIGGKPFPTWEWHIDSHRRDIVVQALSYALHIRAVPRLWPSQDLGLAERGGISFETTTTSDVLSQAGDEW